MAADKNPQTPFHSCRITIRSPIRDQWWPPAWRTTALILRRMIRAFGAQEIPVAGFALDTSPNSICDVRWPDGPVAARWHAGLRWRPRIPPHEIGFLFPPNHLHRDNTCV